MASKSQVQVQQTTDVLNTAAAKYGIPASTLFGIWGMETNFGQNVKTSSSGAVGDFQFLPSTASSYSYPLTNTPTMAEFQQQADAAAHYISDLLKQHSGNMDAALKAYSGGGYGAAQVQAKAGAGPGSTLGGISVPGLSSINPAGGIDYNPLDTLSGLDQIGQALADIAKLVTSGAFWLRALEVIAGVALLIMGLMSLSGRTTTPVTVAKGAARNASKAAVAAA
jgi:soluble lytic murein transglycosylase-like protein